MNKQYELPQGGYNPIKEIKKIKDSSMTDFFKKVTIIQILFKEDC